MPELIPVDHDPFNDPPTNLIPVDHDPFASLGAQPKEGQTVAPQNVQTDIASLPPKVAGTVGDMLGLTDAAKALRGEMTPEEAEKFALYAAAGLVTPEMRAARAAMNAAEKVAPEAAQAVTQGIRAYHGSPYDFDKFDISKIGTGEGAQAYGHGLYFAENPETALSYRNQLAPRDVLLERNGKAFDPLTSDDIIDRVTGGDLIEAQYPTFDSAISAINKKMAAYDPALELPDYGLLKQMRDRVQQWKDAGIKLNATEKGKMYEVNINADPEHFLDWDKPLSEQPQITEKIKASLPYQQMAAANHFGYSPQEFAALPVERQQKLISETSPKTHEAILWSSGAQAYHTFADALEPLEGAKTSGTRTAAEKLREAGIPGIKYLDQGSRGAGEGTKNYVVFNDKLVDIIKKYGLAGLVAGGAAHYQTTPVDHNPFE